MSELGEIEDLGEEHRRALEALGVRTTDDLLAAGASPAGRRSLAGDLGVDERDVLRWVSRADLRRVEGVDEEYADLLQQAGVETVPELAGTDAANLASRLAEVNDEHDLVPRLPTEDEVTDWIERAQGLPRVLVYRDAVGGAIESALLGKVGPAEPVVGRPARVPAGDELASAEAVAELLPLAAPLPRAVADPSRPGAGGARGWLRRAIDRVLRP